MLAAAAAAAFVDLLVAAAAVDWLCLQSRGSLMDCYCLEIVG